MTKISKWREWVRERTIEGRNDLRKVRLEINRWKTENLKLKT